jgi:two-component system C4-dicarboxylate transport sensor histidine kinase DctB
VWTRTWLNWEEFVRFPTDSVVAENRQASPWVGALLMVLVVSGADAWLDGTRPFLDRFLFDVAWFAPALLVRLGYGLSRGLADRPVDMWDRHVDALDALWVLMCPAAIAITGNLVVFGAFSLMFFGGSLFYAWVGGSNSRYPWVAVMTACAASVPVGLLHDQRSWMFLGLVLAPSIFTGLILGGISRANHAELRKRWEQKESEVHQAYSTTLRQHDALSRSFLSMAGTHHDISNALTGALLSSAMMSKKAVAQAVDTQTEVPPAEFERLQRQLHAMKGILDAARSLSQELDPTSQQAHTVASIAHSLDEACRWLSEANVHLELERELDGTCPAVKVKGGPLSLSRVFHNLLLNAAQGDGQQGATRVVVRSWAQGGRTHVSVSDDGPGFGPDQLTAPTLLFQTTKAAGSGLGLANVEFTVREGGGVLRRSNGSGGGAVISFDLESAPG